MLYQYEFKKYY